MNKMRKKLITTLIAVLFTVNVQGAVRQGQGTPTLQQIGEKAVVVIKRKRTESLNGYLLVMCKSSRWKALEKDSDLGPFLKYKKAASNLDAIVALPENAKNGSTYGIYFQDNKPIGFVEIKTGQGEKISDANVAKAYSAVIEDSDQGATGRIRFEPVEVESDDSQPIPALKVVDDGQALLTDPKEDLRSGTIKTLSGYLLVWNQRNNYYILEIKGKDVRQTSTERKFFSVDGMFLQIVDAPIDNVVEAVKRTSLDDKAILEAHRDWEAKYLAEEYKAKLEITSSWQKLSNGKDALLWGATLPETAKGNVKKQVYLTMVKGDYILMLGGAVTDTIGENATQQLLLTTIETLKTSDKPTDLQKLRDAARKESSGNGVN